MKATNYDVLNITFFSPLENYESNKENFSNEQIQLLDDEIHKFEIDFKSLDNSSQDRVFNRLCDVEKDNVFDSDSYEKLVDIVLRLTGNSNKEISSTEYYNTLQKYVDGKVLRANKDIDNITEHIDSIEKEINKYKEYEIVINDKIHDAKDKLITLTVTVLGIFCSLTFSLSGSLGLLNSMFNSNNASFWEALAKFSLIGMFVANLVFLLLYCISRMNNKSLSMHCPKCATTSNICKSCDNIRYSKIEDREYWHYTKKCHGCEHKNTSCSECNEKPKHLSVLCKFSHKFFYIFVINIVCVILFFVGTFGMIFFQDDKSDNIEQTQQTNEYQQNIIPSEKTINYDVEVNANIDTQQSTAELEHENLISERNNINNSAVEDKNQKEQGNVE